MSAQAIIDHLNSLANPDIAEHSQRFFKTAKGEYGCGDVFLGIRVPVIRRAVKQFESTSLVTAKKLLKSRYHEVRLFALLLLVMRFSRAHASEQERVYRLYLDSTKYINNWDLVDCSAPHIVGCYLFDKDRAVLYEMAGSDLLWERRIAIMATFYFIRQNQFSDALKISKQLLQDREDLIHKAVGWMLREIGKRDKAAEVKFLDRYYRQMPRTMLRYAIEKFSKVERQQYMLG